MEIPQEYKLVRRAIRALRGCVHPQQKITAIEYARLAIERDIKPGSNKAKEVERCEIEKDTIFKFVCALAGDRCNNSDFPMGDPA